MFEEGSFRRRPRGFRRKCQALKPYNNYFSATPSAGNGTCSSTSASSTNPVPGNDLGSPGPPLYLSSHHHPPGLHHNQYEALALSGLGSHSSNGNTYSSGPNGSSSALNSGEYPSSSISPASAISVIQNNPYAYHSHHHNQHQAGSMSPSVSYVTVNNGASSSSNFDYYSQSPPHYGTTNNNNSNNGLFPSNLVASHYTNSDYEPNNNNSPPSYTNHSSSTNAGYVPCNNGSPSPCNNSGITNSSWAMATYCGPVSPPPHYFTTVTSSNRHLNVSPNDPRLHSQTPTSYANHGGRMGSSKHDSTGECFFLV